MKKNVFKLILETLVFVIFVAVIVLGFSGIIKSI